jgi:hypothetical protein
MLDHRSWAHPSYLPTEPVDSLSNAPATARNASRLPPWPSGCAALGASRLARRSSSRDGGMRSGPRTVRSGWGRRGPPGSRPTRRATPLTKGPQTSPRGVGRRRAASGRSRPLPRPLGPGRRVGDASVDWPLVWLPIEPALTWMHAPLPSLAPQEVIPTRLGTDTCPASGADGADTLWVTDEEAPSTDTGIDDGVVAVPNQGGQFVAAEEFPNVLHRIELGAIRG